MVSKSKDIFSLQKKQRQALAIDETKVNFKILEL